ncbi:hypothetical protein C3E97_017750 [Pseudomonas sp. MWU12-2115]|uniref:hypothetical protein n=1 Tax=unclassified Pseudomonas TaxID=196821 RepID=UPI000CD5415C|nr:hypothetical protein [Pseudomonas sp. MWU12-2020]RBC00270.1 hypothetical protein C3E97_017750 [Pseudomonas sp. MWU12-2115]
MSLLNQQPPSVTLNFSLPADFVAPQGGISETRVSVKRLNSAAPVTIKDWRHASLYDAGWKFDFPHPYSDVGVKYQVNVQMLHNRQPLLIELDYFVTVNKAPHRQTLHLSPIGQLYVEVQEPTTVPAEEAVTIRLHQLEQPQVELVRVNHDEQTATSFYLKYDPESVIPGKRYVLSAVENRYHQAVPVSPGSIELSPVAREQQAWSFQALMHWLEKPLRLFTDADAKIR